MKYNNNLVKINYNNSFERLTDEVKKYKEKNKNANIISLSIGDVSLPITKPIIDKMKEAVEELGNEKTFKGYGAHLGYDFLKRTILDNEYKNFNFDLEEIYISSGTKSDVINILELFDINSKICIFDPTYPIYINGSSILNRNISIIKGYPENDFLPSIPKEKYDIIYMCSPNNPVGIMYPKTYLEKWIKYAKENNSIILYDNVYSNFINDSNKIKSIYEIEGAKEVAIEFRSFSKSISFSGVRCSYYIIPNNIDKNINKIWRKRVINRFNGACYIAQKGALGAYDKEVQKLIDSNIKYYLDNAKYLKETFEKNGFKVWGGVDAPYLWVKIKEKNNSWEEFYFFLEKLNIIIVPGIIFGEEGDNYFRISSLGKREDINKALGRINDYYDKKI